MNMDKKIMNLASNPLHEKTHPVLKLGFGKSLLLLCAICCVYALLIPTDVLTQHPSLLPFVTAMETALPAIKGFARFSPVPEIVRFYYSTMWILFPLLYLWVRMRWMEGIKLSSVPEKIKLLNLVYGALIGIAGTALYLLVIGFHEASPHANIKPILTGGRGNALFMGLAVTPAIFGIVSAFAWWNVGIWIEITGICLKHIFIRR